MPSNLSWPPPVRRLWLTHVLCALALVALVNAQGGDPRADFLDTLGQFSRALEGTFGDEGRTLAASLGSMAAALSRWDESIRNSERGMAADIGRADTELASRMHLALGGLYLDRLRVSDALKEFASARMSDPSRPEAPLFAGLAYTQLLGNTEAATGALQAAHALDPRDPARTYLFARHLLATNQQEKGLQLLEGLQNLRGTAPSATGTPFIRLDLVRETPGADPFFPPVSYAAGFAALQRGDLSQAIVQLRESADRDPLMLVTTADAGDPVGRVVAAFRQGLVEEARQQLESAIAASPDRSEHHRLLGMVHLANGDTGRAAIELKAAIRLNPHDERAPLTLAGAFLEIEQLEEAERTLLDARQALPASARAHYLLGLTYQRQGRRPDALRELEAAASSRPLLGANTLYRMLGTLYQADQDLDAAAKAFEASVDLVPNDHNTHRDLGRIYFLQGDDVKARAEFEVALLIDPSDADAHTAIGQVHLRNARHDDAASESRRALEIDPAHREARYVHATALIRMGRTDEGTSEMQVFQRLQAEDAEARGRTFEVGRLRREAVVARAGGDHANAVALLQRVLVYEPRSATSHLDLGLALLEAGQPAAAVERLTTAAALNAPFDVHRHLAAAYAALGQKEESQKEQTVYERLKRESISRTGRAR